MGALPPRPGYNAAAPGRFPGGGGPVESHLHAALSHPPGGLGMNPFQSFMTPPPTMAFQFMGQQAHTDAPVQQLSPEEMATKPRPHPHLPSSTLYISHVPSDLEEMVIARALKDCMPVRIRLEAAVPPNIRVQPDAYYDWMPKSGTLSFDDMYNVEKAMAILVSHPLFTSRGVMISPYPPPAPLPIGNSRARYIRPTQRVLLPLTHVQDPTDRFMVQCPTPGELFEAVRGWGSVRDLRVWAETPPYGLPGYNPAEPMRWGARVEYWYEDEARRFEVGFGQRGSHLKGWQVLIMTEPVLNLALPPMLPDPFGTSLPPLPIVPTLPQTPERFAFNVTDLPPDQMSSTFAKGQALGTPALPLGSALPNMVPHPPSFFPLTPPSVDLGPPWAAHNPFTVSGTDVPQIPSGPIQVPFPLSPPDVNLGSPGTPLSPGHDRRIEHTGPVSLGSRPSNSSLRSSTRSRNWSVTLEEGPDGDLRPVGLVADDGMVIQHGPGQHIRPAPAFGPGSTSLSGLVDYSNVFVKNLEPDVNSEFLGELFSSVGRIVSARVMRDSLHRSRGYGFVSFSTPAEAAAAIQHFNGAKVGANHIAVTLHEPKKLRPEKLLERRAVGTPTAYGRRNRRSISPVHITQRNGRRVSDQSTWAATTDQIRSLSPDSRKDALIKRVTPAVIRYARAHSFPLEYSERASAELASQDLALVPLLHDSVALDAKIAETLKALHEDESSDLGSANAIALAGDSVTPAEVDQLRLGIEMIDPVDVDAIMPFFMRGITGGEVKLCIQDRSELAIRYNTAKKQLNESRAPHSDVQVAPEQIPLPPSEAEPPGFESIELSSATLEGLASLPAAEIMRNLEGPEADALLTRLGVSRPTAATRSAVDQWTRKTMAKPVLERRTDMVNVLAKKIDTPARRSEKLKIARDMVQAESDDEAMCRLMAYPQILLHKIKDNLEALSE